MSLGPNKEQRAAIEHHGGVLLQAGAGSGKTFVLVQHLLYIITNEIEKAQGLTDEEFERQIRAKLSSVVMITFTNKAAGELALRISKNIEAKIGEAQDQLKSKWLVVHECLSHLNVGTIHGFCLKLIKQGHFKEIEGSEIFSDVKLPIYLERYFKQYVASVKDQYPRFLIDILISSSDQLIESLEYQFQDSGIRSLWNEKNDFLLNLEGLLPELIRLLGCEHIFTMPEVIIDDKAALKTKWYEYYTGFMNRRDGIPKTFQELKKLYDFFSEYSRSPAKPKNGSEEIREFFDLLKDFRKFVLDNYEFFLAAKENKDEAFTKWNDLIQGLHVFVENKLSDKNGLLFSDLEYFVYQGLQNQDVANQIQSRYSYIIIDEYQDTSYLQYHIIKKIINSDFRRGFFVGDIKQAIYGFRGGELFVFENSIKKMPQFLELKSNYRSRPVIIDFNNRFFEFIFTTGENFEGRSTIKIPMYYQERPEGMEYDDIGKVNLLRTRIEIPEEKKKKLASNEIERLEANVIANQIIDLINEGEKGIAILYKKLGPSIYLINELLERKIGFSTQVKVPFSQEPIWGIFSCLIDYLSSEDKLNYKYFEFCITQYLKILNIDKKIDIDQLLMSVKSFYDWYGLYPAFLKLLKMLNLAISSYQNSLKNIKEVITSAGDDVDILWSYFDNRKQNRFSVEFHSGENTHTIQLMTTHASKGLEFNHVFLGGVYTNGRTRTDLAVFGKTPGSFKWKETSSQKQMYKSPQYILEQLQNKLRSESEDKRLLYVACTRAVKELHLIYFDIQEDVIKPLKNSWINAFLKFNSLTEIAKFKDFELPIEIYDEASSIEGSLPPLFHKDRLGISGQHRSHDLEEFAILPELSITRIADVFDCPRKFYLSSVCKISDKALENISSYIHNPLNKSSEGAFSDIKSTKERGTNLHYMISEWIYARDNKFYDLKSPQDVKAFEYGTNFIKNYESSYDLISEEVFKFEFFGQMITAIPDLLLKPKNEQAWIIADFKTGAYKEDVHQKYLFQVLSYAWGLAQLGVIKKETEVQLEILYLDEQRTIKTKVDWSTIEKELFQAWSLTQHPEQINSKHCGICSFGNICRGDGQDVAQGGAYDKII